MLHAAREESNAVVVAKDTDVLILLRSQRQSSSKCFLTVDFTNYIDIAFVLDYFGRDICNVLPQFHVMTGCDTNCYRLRTDKVRTFQKLIKDIKKHQTS